RYLPEHVFAGTPLMPTVMGLEAMVQAAMACLGTREVPLIRQIVLKRPLIVSEESGTVVRIQALCDARVDNTITVVVRMGSDGDGFAADHFEIRCLFGSPQPELDSVPVLPALPEESYPKGPEEFAPSPLFQGRFLRRINHIFALRPFEESLTEMTAPVGARYYSAEFEQQTRTLSPAICDSMLQAAGLMAPAGYLPESIEEIRTFRPLREGERLICWARGMERGEASLTTDILLYDQAGNPLQWIKGLVVKAPSTAVDLQPRLRTKQLTPERIQASLQGVLRGTPLSLALAHDSDLLRQTALSLLPMQEREELLQDVAQPRQTSKLVNLLATRKSAIQYFRDSRQPGFTPDQIQLRHADDGKPQLSMSELQNDTDQLSLSLADSHGVSTAVIGETPVGIDIEVIETRDSETWLGLLGDDGYALALRMQRETGESFDISATRVWTLIEAGKKANGLQRGIPRFSSILGEYWVALDGPEGETGRMLSTMIDDEENQFVMSLAIQDGASSMQERQYG
ncbi:MAG: polyketide synthase dehydratase domain-containing protein, partial [Pseudomonadota bacterium]